MEILATPRPKQGIKSKEFLSLDCYMHREKSDFIARVDGSGIRVVGQADPADDGGRLVRADGTMYRVALFEVLALTKVWADSISWKDASGRIMMGKEFFRLLSSEDKRWREGWLSQELTTLNELRFQAPILVKKCNREFVQFPVLFVHERKELSATHLLVMNEISSHNSLRPSLNKKEVCRCNEMDMGSSGYTPFAGSVSGFLNAPKRVTVTSLLPPPCVLPVDGSP
ncbi:hypothetical protein BDZ89DRAFT_1166374 [Hymenopellis radicata]|nr:hypothetical protein BDZ89DRAFT_1166374 [Hymenopellis radicata]